MLSLKVDAQKPVAFLNHYHHYPPLVTVMISRRYRHKEYFQAHWYILAKHIFDILPVVAYLSLTEIKMKQSLFRLPLTIREQSNMGLKHLFGYALIIVGMALAPLLYLFMAEEQSFNPIFLISLGFCAVLFFFCGLIILNRTR